MPKNIHTVTKLILINILTFLFFIEIGSFGLTQLKLLPISETPALYRNKVIPLFTSKTSFDNTDTNWWNENSSWGAWHKSNSISRHVKRCFEVTYQSNSVGARDSEFNGPEVGNRLLLLGDSVVESIGVSKENKLDVALEKKIDTDVMNFGSAGDFGPVQYFELYRNLANNYYHNTLIVFFLPSNDFLDNDYSFWRTSGKTFFAGTNLERFRPYFEENSESKFNVFRPENAVPRSDWRYPKIFYDIRFSEDVKIKTLTFIEDNFWASNLVKSIRLNLKAKQLLSSSSQEYSGYFDATMKQQRAAIFYIKSIIRISSADNILLVAVPRESDLNRIKFGGKVDTQIWYKAFRDFSKLSKKNIDFLDLASTKIPDRQITHQCDGHWNKEGIRWAANAVAERLEKNGFLKQ